MAERTVVVPVVTNTDGSVSPRRRAAALKEAVWSYTQDNTIKVSANWKKSTAEWELDFKDE